MQRGYAMSIPLRSQTAAARCDDPRARVQVLGARAVRYAAAPMLALDLAVDEPSGRPVYMIALTIQLMIEPARRSYDDATRDAADRAVRGAGALGGDDPQPGLVASSTCSCRRSPARSIVPVPIACNYDLEVAADEVPALAARRRGAAGAALQRDGLLPGRGRRAADGAGAVDQLDRLPHAGVGLAGDDRALLPEHRLGGAALGDARGAAAPRRSTAGCATLRRLRRASCSRRAARMTERSTRSSTRCSTRATRSTPTRRRGEERDTDAVRDRLPAALRGGLLEHLRPPRAALRARRAGRRDARGRGPLPRADGERHQARSRSGSRCARRAGRLTAALDCGAAGTDRARRSRCGSGCSCARSARRRQLRGRAARREPHASCRAASTAPARWRARCSRR